MLDAGDPALDFDLPRPTAGGSETYRLSAAAREGPVVLAFYPVTDTAESAKLLREIASVDWGAVTDRLSVLAVGVGDRASHDRLAEQVDVPFPLLLDQDGFFAERYGILEPLDERTIRVRPALFVVGEDCFVRYAWAAGDSAQNPGEDLPLDEIRSAVASG
ncbi:Peroxiredoxin [Halomicrobium zhouii]|uniref:Peroxiredoxin n=1 Tax=Halomicrobium zhouii TaxID=767519 RepID=A0A1I6LBF4_9EURY|nr:redoxin domain-containing protein [Halomicrobium zhouii]SFS00777.1 Peroxiredoxin [Halomicrobium zhouii]